MVIRLVTPGLSSPARTTPSESVMARLKRRMMADSSSVISTKLFVLVSDLLIFLSGSCRLMILAPVLLM
ncbi:hypothetical protein EVA_16878 [gut metagenome]|uniref:Uncharacterized protein n=1 Tax=gut metagenome TaxID=749906 RepID=J9G699_9ZZZZ